MSIKRTSLYLLAPALVLLLAQATNAQVFQPIAELNFDSNFQLFAPVELEEYGGHVPPRTGWFATYDRVYINMSRAQHAIEIVSDFTVLANVNGDPFILVDSLPNIVGAPGSADGDFTWGNRFEIGYMTEEDRGWSFTAWGIGSPNQTIDTSSVNRNQRMGVDLQGDADQKRNTINTATLSSIELNKIFRLDPLEDGTIIEPFIGGRFVKFTDMLGSQYWSGIIRVQDSEDEDTAAMPPVEAVDEIDEDQFRSISNRQENNMYGGQLGLRIHSRRGRWVISSEFRSFALYNNQLFSNEDRVDTNVQRNADPVLFSNFVTQTSDHTTEMVIGGELRAEATFEITQKIAVRFGVDWMEFAQGIGRAASASSNNENLRLVGATFGFTLNR